MGHESEPGCQRDPVGQGSQVVQIQAVFPDGKVVTFSADSMTISYGREIRVEIAPNLYAYRSDPGDILFSGIREMKEAVRVRGRMSERDRPYVHKQAGYVFAWEVDSYRGRDYFCSWGDAIGFALEEALNHAIITGRVQLVATTDDTGETVLHLQRTDNQPARSATR